MTGNQQLADLRAQLYRANLGYFEEAKENKDLRSQLQAAQQERDEQKRTADSRYDQMMTIHNAISGGEFDGGDPSEYVEKVRLMKQKISNQRTELRQKNTEVQARTLDAANYLNACKSIQKLADERGKEIEQCKAGLQDTLAHYRAELDERGREADRLRFVMSSIASCSSDERAIEMCAEVLFSTPATTPPAQEHPDTCNCGGLMSSGKPGHTVECWNKRGYGNHNHGRG